MKKIIVLVTISLLTFTAQSQILIEGSHIDSTFPTAAAIGDFNGDGYIDMVQALNRFLGVDVINANLIWLNDGDNTFTLHDSIGDSQTNDISTIDIDNDGDIDIIAGNARYASISRVWLNDGNANFSLGQALTSNDTQTILVADFNEDGFPDVFCGNVNTNENDTLYLNDGNGMLTEVSNPWTSGAKTIDAEAFDVNSDGHIDLVLCRADAPNTIKEKNEIWFGNGDGTFINSPQSFPYVTSWRMAVGDYNNDGKVDVIFHEDGIVKGYSNDGSNVFNSSEDLYNLSYVTDVDLVDIDLDNDLDLLIARFSTASNFESEILFNDGNGNFTDGSESFSISDTFSIEIFDIDQDTDLDLFTINKNNQDNVFWMNQTDPILSNQDQTIAQFKLYPSPASNYIRLSNSPNNTVNWIELYNSFRKKINTFFNKNNELSWDVSSLANGVYFCKINFNENDSEIIKFIKE